MDQSEFFRLVVDALEELQIPYMVVGSFASGAYGEPRMTQDIDIVVNLRYGDAEELGKRFAPPDFYLNTQSAKQAIRTCGQFNIIHGASGNKVDLMLLRDSAWNAKQFERRKRLEIITGREASIATPEDIILSKMLWYKEGGSEKHLRDITGMLTISENQIDFDYVANWSKKLEVEDVWQAVLRRVGKSKD
jgi:hypothetical protein